MNQWCSLGLFLARLCLAAVFLLSGLGKLMDYHGNEAYMLSKGMTMIPFFLYAAAFAELAGGLSVALGIKTRGGALLLLLLMIPTTLIFHDFWNVEGGGRQLEMIMFLKNTSICGGLMYVLCCGPGSWAFDHWSSYPDRS